MYKITVRCKGTAKDKVYLGNEGFTHMVSIQDYGDEPVPTPPSIRPENHLHRFFDDLDIADQGSRTSARYAGVIRTHYPNDHDIKTILEFGKTIPDGSNLFLHCFAGVARSTATCYALYAQQLGPGKEQEALRLTVKSSIAPWPNDLIVKIADELLERNGALFNEFDIWRKRMREMWETLEKDIKFT